MKRTVKTQQCEDGLPDPKEVLRIMLNTSPQPITPKKGVKDKANKDVTNSERS